MNNKHPLIEDIFALLSASALISLGVFFLKAAGLLSGGTTGLALILAELTPSSFGFWFFCLNVPFYYLAWRYIGKRFTINTFISVTVISFCTDHLADVLQFQSLDSIYAAVISGLLVGSGMLVMFRHSSSLGGFGILSIYLQQRFKIPAGKTMMTMDFCIMIAAFFIVSVKLVILSVIASALVSLVLILNHKPNRYQLVRDEPKS